MIVHCHQELFEMFPGASVHAVLFDGVGEFDPAVGALWKNRAQESIRASGITAERLVESPEIKEWRDAFHKFGVKPSKHRSSIEQLSRRALKGDIIQTKLPLVNLYCYVSLMQSVPMGAYDLEKIEGDIAVRLTRPDEAFVAIGDDSPMVSDPGVVVYSDDGGIICWAWNHRDAERTCLGPESNRVIFFADSASNESGFRAATAIALLSEAISATGANKLAAFVLNRTNPAAMVDL